MLIDAIISAGAGAMVATIVFVVIKAVIAAQDTSTWSGAEIATITNLPVILGLVAIIGMFSFLAIRRRGGI